MISLYFIYKFITPSNMEDKMATSIIKLIAESIRLISLIISFLSSIKKNKSK